MVVVDQFEELFAFRRTGASREDVISRDEAAGFVKLLLRASPIRKAASGSCSPCDPTSSEIAKPSWVYRRP
jgi:hypothetical protein